MTDTVAGTSTGESTGTTSGTEPLWWRSSVVYQIYPRSFADSDGDGVGDLRGILRHVDHLADLGVDVVWLSPIYRSPQDDNGYDISDYRDVDPLFGTLEDLDELIEALQGKGIRLMMDLVVNHTSDEHPWFVESRSSADNPKRDWYWWRAPREGKEAGEPGAEPTNWASFFSGPTWELDETTGEYYLHLFSRKQPDLNWENPEVREAVYDMMRWWLDRGVGGFRMDVINMLSKDPALPDGVPGTVGTSQPDLADGTPHFYCGPRLHEFLQEMHREVFADRPSAILTVGEMPGTSVEEARLVTDPARHELDMVFQFEHVDIDVLTSKWEPRKPLLLTDLKASFARWQTQLAEVGWNSLYWDNHDQPRAVSRFGDDRPQYRVASAKTLATVLHLHRGTPYVYQGEEIGMANTPFRSVDELRDIEALNHYAGAVAAGHESETVLAAIRKVGRDNARTPVQWNDSEHAGFTTGTPWMAVNPDYLEVNVAAQEGDPDSVLAHHRRLIRLRKDERAVVDGVYTLLLPDDPDVFAFTRTTDEVELLVLASFSAEPVTVGLDLHEWSAADVLLPTHDDGGHGLGEGGKSYVLRPWESLVLRRRLSV